MPRVYHALAPVDEGPGQDAGRPALTGEHRPARDTVEGALQRIGVNVDRDMISHVVPRALYPAGCHADSRYTRLGPLGVFVSEYSDGKGRGASTPPMDLPPVTDLYDHHDQHVVLDLVDAPVDAEADSVPFLS